MFKKVLRVWLIAVLLTCLAPAGAMADTLTAYFNDFDVTPAVASGVGAALSGVTTTEGVQGYAGLGPDGNQFGGNFLRNTSAGNPAQYTTLTLTGLPAHTSVNVNFLLGLIDSWDGYDSAWGPDAFNVKVGEVSVFSQVFAIGSGTMTYSPPSGVLLASGTDRGFQNWAENAYNMYLESAFQNIAHTGSSLTISWFASGPGWQGGENDESWAIENVRVDLNNVPLPPTVVLLGSGLLGLLGAGWRLRKP